LVPDRVLQRRILPGPKGPQIKKGGIKLRVVLFENSSVIQSAPEFSLSGNPVGYVNGFVHISEEEKRKLIKEAKRIWEKARKGFSQEKFIGHVRFDMIPDVEHSFPKKKTDNGSISYDLGNLEVKGCYEINAQDPECAAADAALKKAVKNGTPLAAKRLAEMMGYFFGKKEIAFVQGNGAVKNCWGSYFFDALRKEGLKTVPMSPKEVVSKKPEVIWRWGIIQWKQDDDLPWDFGKWLLRAQNNSTTVVNHLFSPQETAVDDKRLVMEKEDATLSQENAASVIKNKENYVLKPLRGGSGRGIYFGKNLTQQEWERAVRFAISNGNYGAFKAKWLPKIRLGKENVTLDANPAFLFDGKELHYLYTIIRLDKWENYQQRGAINVARGGGFAGTAAEG